VSIVDYGQPVAPVIDRTAFPGTASTSYLASTPSVGSTEVWLVSFLDGMVSATYLDDLIPGTVAVRCVRGGHGPFASHPGPAPAGRYTAPTTGTVYDAKMRLTWAAVPPMAAGAYEKDLIFDAQRYCAALGDGGITWRLPTIGELLTIVDRSQLVNATSPLADPTFFPETPPGSFWASTSFAEPPSGGGTDTWSVRFQLGTTAYVYATDGYVRCVH
jgi:hypothetical protein